MASLVSPGLIDLILVGVLLEALALLALFTLTGRGVPARMLLPNLAAGASLFIALRLVLAGAAMHWVALALLAALGGHLLDLILRWQQGPERHAHRPHRQSD